MSAAPFLPLPTLDEGAFSRAFPFYLHLDVNLCVRSAGTSLRKTYPAVQTAVALQTLFSIRLPRAINSIEDWRPHALKSCTLVSVNHQALTLRGSAEICGDGLLLLVSPVLNSLEEVTRLGLGFNDFAKHDASCDALLMGQTSRALKNDADQMAVRLRGRSEQISTMLELSRSGIAYFDSNSLLQHSNTAMLTMLGITRAESFDLNITSLDERIDSLLAAGETLRKPLALAMNNRSTDMRGLVFHIERPQPAVINLDTARAKDGGWVFYMRNVTREFELDRMKSEFLQTAAHELRTPMVSVYGFTELLLNRPVSELQRRDMLETIHRQSKLLINVVNEMLDLARLESRQGKDLKCTSCRLGSLVDQALALFAQPGITDHRLQANLSRAETRVNVDASQILRAFTNVLSNAFKYSLDGGMVTVDTLDGALHGHAAVGVRITDYGIGMTADQQERVFERFYRADPSGNTPGTGLGMSLVKQIIELHGGGVAVWSELGRGTAVTLWLPLERSLPAQLAAP